MHYNIRLIRNSRIRELPTLPILPIPISVKRPISAENLGHPIHQYNIRLYLLGFWLYTVTV